MEPSGRSLRVEAEPEREALSRDSHRSVAQLDMLHSLARRLNQLQEVAQIGEAIAAELRTVIDYHNCRVHLLSDDGTMLIPVAFRGELSEYQGETFDALTLHVGQGITGRVAQTGTAYYSPNTSVDDTAVNIPGTPDVDESLLVVPLKNGERVIGTVALAKLGVDQFDLQDETLLEILASHAAVAFENARLLERARETARLSTELLKFSQGLTRVNDVPAVLTAVAATIPALIGCAAVHVYLRDEVDGSFRLAAWGKDDQAGPTVVPREVGEPFLLSVEEPFVLSSEDRRRVPDGYRFVAYRGAVMIAPFRWEPNGLGVVVIHGPDDAEFARTDLQYARGIADITALAVGNATRFQEMEQTASRLRAIDEMKNTFLDAVSHELRTPLSAVLGIALTLQRKDLDLPADEIQDLVSRLAGNARKLSRLLSDLLDLDRLARGIITPNRRPIDLADLVTRTVAESDLLGDREVVLRLAPQVLAVDPPKVERIVENLLSNAARHTPPATPITVSLEAVPGGALLKVEDQGPGVPEELRDTIFQPFKQGPQRQAHAPGVGIGLSLVGRFAELHGGRAWVEEAPGGGSSFRVFLPDEPGDQETDRGEEREAS